MFKFNEFILENLITELILESKVQFSRDFLNILNGIGGRIADELKKLHGVDKEVTQNYIDIDMDNNNMLTFIQDRRAQQMIGDIEEIYKITSNTHLKHEDFASEASENSNRIIYTRLNMTFDDVNKADAYNDEIKITAETSSRTSGNIYIAYQGVNDETLKGVIRKDRVAPVENEIWTQLWNTSRNAIRAGRLVRAFLNIAGIKFIDTEIEEFVNNYKSHIDILNDAFAKFDEVSGNQLIHFYEYDNYNLEENSGTLGNSCMADVPGSYLEMYRVNPNKVKLVILYDDAGSINDAGKYSSNNIIGRALLWETDAGYKFMDRIYYTVDSLRDLFKKYATRNGYFYRVDYDYDNGHLTVSNGNVTKTEAVIVTLDNNSFDEYPYLDSLMYYNHSSVSSSRNANHAEYCLNDTGGEYEYID